MKTYGKIIPGIPKFGQPKYSSDDLNELRLNANEIMRILFEHKAKEQLNILRLYAEIAIKNIK